MTSRKKAFVVVTSLAALGFAALSFAQSPDPQPSRDGKQQAPVARTTPEPRRHAIAELEPSAGSDVRGTVRFEETAGGVRVKTSVTNLPAGLHAYHVHVYGDCSSADASSAGPHYRFGPNDTGITGDLGELVPSAGLASADRLIAGASLRGARSIVGRAVVVHAKGNDPSQPPDGAAGARLACGVIGVDEAPAASGSQQTEASP